MSGTVSQLFTSGIEIATDMQVEIAMFLFAGFMHVTLFGSRGLLKRVALRCGPKGNQAKSVGKPKAYPETSDSLLGEKLAQVQLLALKEGADVASLTKKTSVFLRSIQSQGSEIDVLTSMLKCMGKKVTCEVPLAVQAVLKDHSLNMNANLGEALLRAYHGLRLNKEFETLFAELVAADSVTPAAQLLAATRATAASDLDSALCRLRKFAASLLPSQTAATASAAPQHLLQKLLGLGGEKGAVPRVVQELQACGLLTPTALEAAMAECARGKNVGALLAVKDVGSAAGVELSSQAVCHLLSGLGAAGRLREAVQFLHASSARRTCHYSALIAACVERRDVEQAEKLLVEAVQEDLVDADSYSAIIRYHLRMKDERRARATLEEMRTAGVQPTLAMFNAVLEVALALNTKSAMRWIDDMSSYGLTPSRSTCALLLQSIQPTTGHDAMDKILEVVCAAGEHMDEALFCQVLDVCVRLNRPECLRRQLALWHTSGRVPISTPHGFASLIRACGVVQKVTAVWAVWRSMHTNRVAATSLVVGCMVEALVQNGDSEGAYELIHELLSDASTKPLVNAVIYCSVLKGFSHQNRMDRMWAIYEEMRESKLQFTIVTYNTLLDACARVTDMARIPGLLDDMALQGIKPNVISYSAIIKGYCREGRLEKAFELLAEMKRADIHPDEHTYNTLLNGCSRKCLYQQGMNLLEEMQQIGLAPSNFTLSVLVNLANRTKGVDKAFELCHEISKKYRFRLNVHVYNNLVNACVTHKDMTRALAVFEEIAREQLRPDTRTYTLLLKGCLAEGRVKEVAGLLRAAAGKRDALPSLTGLRAPQLLQPQGGLPSSFVWEMLEGILKHRGNESLALELYRDVQGPLRVQGNPTRLMKH